MTHSILISHGPTIGHEVVHTDTPVADIARGEWRNVLGVARDGLDVTVDVMRDVAALLRDQGYAREELPEYVVDSLQIW